MRPTASRAERVAGVRSPVLGVEPEERWRGRGPSLRWRGLSVRDDDHAESHAPPVAWSGNRNFGARSLGKSERGGPGSWQERGGLLLE